MVDLVPALVARIVQQLKVAFDPSGPMPPVGGGCAPRVQRFAGDVVTLDSVGSDDKCGCGEPYLWVRLARRYHTTEFPAEIGIGAPCGSVKAVVIEVGIARCVSVGDAETPPSMEDRDIEFAILSDDGWRIDEALCRAAGFAKSTDRTIDNFVLGAGEPAGPEGGLITWIQTGIFQING